MPLSPFHVWVITYGLCCAFFFAAPNFRIPILILTILHIAVFIWGIVNIRSQFFGRVLFRGNAALKKIALTFDDGPDPNLTPEVLNLLAQYDVKATFFVIGTHARTFPHLVKRAFDEGHLIACHDLTHAISSNFRMTAALVRDIAEAQKIIHLVIGKKSLLYRPPVGLMNPHAPIALARLNMTCVGWNRRVRDAGNRREKTLQGLPGLAKPGSIILLHDCLPKQEVKTFFLAQLEKLLQTIQKNGLQPVSVDELLDVKAYG